MAIYSLSRYFSEDGETGYVNIFGGGLGQLTIKCYYNKQALESFTAPLTLVSGSLYSFPVLLETEEDDNRTTVESLINFEIYNNGVLEVSYVGDDTYSYPEYNHPPNQITIPRHEEENKVVENRIYRLWITYYPEAHFQRKISLGNTIPSGINAAFYTLTVPNDRLFQNAFYPTEIERSVINNMLSDPVALWEGESGDAFYVRDEDKIVIPLSDRSSTWTEEYDRASFLDIQLDWPTPSSNPPFFIPTVHDTLAEVGSTTRSVNGFTENKKYRESDISGGFLNEIRALEENYVYEDISIIIYGVGSGSGRPFQIESVGGVLYRTDNFD